MQHYLINGNFLCRNLTGIERFSWEVCKQLDILLADTPDLQVSMLVPANAKRVPTYTHIQLIHSPKAIKGFPFWDLGVFAKAVKQYKAIGLNFSNTAPLGKRCGIAFIHDIYAKMYPQDFVTFKDKLIRLYCRLNYANIAHNAKKVVTVSEYSKQQIADAYHIDKDTIAVVGNGWDHFTSITENTSILQQYPQLTEKGYYFTLGSLSKRKNLAWIVKYASAHPQDIFAVSGKAISGLVPDEIQQLQTMKNVVLVGYVTDEQVKALMTHCKAFVFPSYYEGFGIPPLEALSVGAPCIVANAASLPEIYGNTVQYIDVQKIDCDLDELLTRQVEPPQAVLAKYTYKNAALQLLSVLQN